MVYLLSTTFLLFILTFHFTKKIRESILITFLCLSIIVLISTEVLSLFNSINFSTIQLHWKTIFITLSIISVFIFKKNIFFSPLRFPSISFPELTIILVITVYLLSLFFLALKVPPNNFDSWSYHLPRVEHWIQNQNVNFYPTGKLNQLFMSPLSGYFHLHLNVLNNYTDIYSNLVQWNALLVTLVAVTLISMRYGADKTTQLISGLITLGIPMVILEATSSQTDILVTSYVSIFVYFLVSIAPKKGLSYPIALILGTSLGLALLSKPTALIFLTPFFIILIFKYLNKSHLRHFLLITILFFVINVGHFYRNYTLFGSPIGLNKYDYEWRNLSFTPPVAVSNFLRNSSIHLATPIDKSNQTIYQIISHLHLFLKINLSDPNTTWPATIYQPPSPRINENESGNTLHFVLLIISSLFFVLSKRLRQQKPILPYIAALWVGYFLFSFILKWQPWHSRLHLPFFILATPPLAIFLSTQIKFTRVMIFLSIILCSLPYLLFNPWKPILGVKNIFNYQGDIRYIPYYPNFQETHRNTLAIIDRLGCHQVGLLLENEMPEYPFWVESKKNFNNQFSFKSVQFNNISSTLTNRNSPPFQKPCDVVTYNKITDLNIENIYFTHQHTVNEYMFVLLPTLPI